MLSGDRLICVQKSPVTPTILPGLPAMDWVPASAIAGRIGQMLSLIRPGKVSPIVPGKHFTQTPLGPQLLKADRGKRAT